MQQRPRVFSRQTGIPTRFPGRKASRHIFGIGFMSSTVIPCTLWTMPHSNGDHTTLWLAVASHTILHKHPNHRAFSYSHTTVKKKYRKLGTHRFHNGSVPIRNTIVLLRTSLCCLSECMRMAEEIFLGGEDNCPSEAHCNAISSSSTPPLSLWN